MKENLNLHHFFHSSTAVLGVGLLVAEVSGSYSFTLNTLSRTPNERSTYRRGLYLTINKTHEGHDSVLQAEIEPALSASERSQTHALDYVATEFGHLYQHL
jgi:hypothetical protein